VERPQDVIEVIAVTEIQDKLAKHGRRRSTPTTFVFESIPILVKSTSTPIQKFQQSTT
jgi:hypothetical protein